MGRSIRSYFPQPAALTGSSAGDHPIWVGLRSTEFQWWLRTATSPRGIFRGIGLPIADRVRTYVRRRRNRLHSGWTIVGPHDHGNGSKARRKASLYRASQAPASRTARRMVLSYQDGPPFGYESLEIKQSACARRENRPYWRGTQQLRKLRASGSRYSLTNG